MTARSALQALITKSLLSISYQDFERFGERERALFGARNRWCIRRYTNAYFVENILDLVKGTSRGLSN